MNQVLDPVDVKELLKERVDYQQRLYNGVGSAIEPKPRRVRLDSKLFVAHEFHTTWLMYTLFDRTRRVGRRAKQPVKDVVQWCAGGSLVELPEYDVHETGACEECTARFEQEQRS